MSPNMELAVVPVATPVLPGEVSSSSVGVEPLAVALPVTGSTKEVAEAKKEKKEKKEKKDKKEKKEKHGSGAQDAARTRGRKQASSSTLGEARLGKTYVGAGSFCHCRTVLLQVKIQDSE